MSIVQLLDPIDLDSVLCTCLQRPLDRRMYAHCSCRHCSMPAAQKQPTGKQLIIDKKESYLRNALGEAADSEVSLAVMCSATSCWRQAPESVDSSMPHSAPQGSQRSSPARTTRIPS